MARVRFGDVVKEIKINIDRATDNHEFYIAGEHMESENIHITKRGRFEGSDVGPAFIRLFRPGQVLYGSRRTYLKKVAVADFEGITSNTTFVLETKDQNVMMQELLPFIMLTDSFTEYTVKNSKGSTNPYILFSDLCAYEFELPAIEEQRYLVERLLACDNAKEAYKRLLSATDELVKSQFIEMFDGKGYSVVNASSFMTNMRNGLSPSKKGTHYEKVLTLSAVTQGVFDPEAWKDGVFDDCPPEDKRIRTSEFYMCRGNGNKTLVGTAVYAEKDYPDLVFPDTVIAAHIDTEKVLLPYLYTAWKMPSIRDQIEENARTTNGTYKINQKVLAGIEIILPSIEKQKEFVMLVEQADKSKFELKQSIERIDNLIKSLIQQG